LCFNYFPSKGRPGVKKGRLTASLCEGENQTSPYELQTPTQNVKKDGKRAEN